MNSNSKFLRTPSIRQFSNRTNNLDGCANLTTGQPDFPAPDVVKKAYVDTINSDKTSCSHNKGLLEACEAVSQYPKNRYRFSYDPEEIIVTNGASEAIDTTLRSIIEPGDKTIISEPIYAGYTPLIEVLGDKPVYIDTTATQFKVTPDALESRISPRTKAVLLNYPTNPTGVVLKRNEALNIVNVLKKYPIFIISDEIYAENTFSSKHVSFAKFEDIRDQLMSTGGLSKSHSAAGIRIGFLLGPQYLIDKSTFIHAYNCICVNVPTQTACITAFNEGLEAPKYMSEAYVERRSYLVSELTELGFETTAQPEGAFYIFPNIKHITGDDSEFCVDLLESTHLAIVPSSSFTEFGKGFVRIFYAHEVDILKGGMKRLAKYLSTK